VILAMPWRSMGKKEVDRIYRINKICQAETICSTNPVNPVNPVNWPASGSRLRLNFKPVRLESRT